MSPWLDLDRRPARRHLLKLSAGEGPRRATASVPPLLARRVAERWAETAGVSADDLVLCASHSDAARLVAQAALMVDDRCLLARPAPPVWLAAVLAQGAAFVDVGRTVSGAADPAVLAACPPHRLAVLARPACTGGDDVVAWELRGPALDALQVVDATLQGALCGVPADSEHLTLVCLRDPLAPAEPALYAVVGRDASALQLVQGPAQLPAALLRRALSIFARVSPEVERAFTAGLAERAATLAAALPLGPGQAWLPQAGVERAVQCLGADGDALVAAAQGEGAAAASYPGFPGGGLVRISLLVAA